MTTLPTTHHRRILVPDEVMPAERLVNYITSHVERGACQCVKCAEALDAPKQYQPTGHTIDLTFFKVAARNNPTLEELRDRVEDTLPSLLDGKEHSYILIGGEIGDQGLALELIALGGIVGLWKVLSPETLLPFMDDATKLHMAGTGMIALQAQTEQVTT